MAKSQKQKTRGKKTKKVSAQKKKTVTSRKKTKKPLSGSSAKQKEPTPSEVGVVTASLSPGFTEIKQSEIKLEDFADVTEERSSIISIVKGLEGQVETAFRLKEVLEEELEATQKRLAEELDARAQLEVQVTSLDVRAALGEQLREDISFAEEERNKFANLLSQIQPQLEDVTEERDSLAEQLSSAISNVKELDGEKMALEAQVMNLKDRIIDVNRLREELVEITEGSQNLQGQLHDTKRLLTASEKSKDAIEKELKSFHQTSQELQKELEGLREKDAASSRRLTDMHIQIEDQQGLNPIWVFLTGSFTSMGP